MPAWEHCRRAFAWVDHLSPAVVVNIATIGPVGHWGRAPGTNGTVIGLLYVAAVYPALSPPGALVVLLLSVYLAVAFCDGAERIIGRRDPGCVILDEVVAMPLCFPGVLGLAYARGWPPWTMALAAFALFRFFDILKPLGISRLQRLPGGLGVVVDDLAAALATCLVLNIAVRVGTGSF